MIETNEKDQIAAKLCQKWSKWRHKMREMRGEVGKKTAKKEMDNHSFLWRHMDHFWHNLVFDKKMLDLPSLQKIP